MTKKKVWQYKCGFCAKKNYSAGAMNKHEKGCTKNPARECGVCRIMGETQAPIADLVACLPDLQEQEIYPKEPGLKFFDVVDPENLLHGALKALRDKANECPACIMAAFRQKGIPLRMAQDNGFDYKAEMKMIFDDLNARNRGEY